MVLNQHKLLIMSIFLSFYSKIIMKMFKTKCMFMYITTFLKKFITQWI